MRGGVVTGALGVALLAVGTAGAGEIVLQDGQRFDEELVGEPLSPPRDLIAGGVAAHGAAHEGATAPDAGRASDMPALTAYQGTPLPPVPSAAPAQVNLPSVAAFQGTAASVPGATGTRILEVIAGESALFRDAYSKARQVGRVAPGEPLLLVDSIDRRLRIMNAVVFDGGEWVKVRAADGTEGWLPAASVRDVR